MRHLLLVILAALAAASFAPRALALDGLPSGFVESTLVSGLDGPVGVAFEPTGAKRTFVVEKEGRIKVSDGFGTATTLVDLSDRVNAYWDRGLLGIALDRDFATTGYLYVVYTHEQDPAHPDGDGPTTSRLSRFDVDAPGPVAATETVLAGTVGGAGCAGASNTSDCIPSEGVSHSIGTVRVDPVDGTIWFGSGDASSFNEATTQSLGTYDEQSFRGKVAHVDRNGRGLASHPFCPSDANLDHVCTKLYAKGFRNPFRFVLRDGKPVVADVGWNTHEELDLAERGRNYGWPCYEGPIHTPTFKDWSQCAALYATEGTAGAVAGPFHSYEHDWYDTGAGYWDNGAAVQAGPSYPGTEPAGFQGDSFFADYNRGWIKRYELSPSGALAGPPETFATGFYGTDLELTPAGDLAYVDFAGNAVKRVAFGDPTPVAQASASPSSGMAPLHTTFSSAGSSDPDGDPLSYDWDFGDGTAHSTAANPAHVYATEGAYTAELTVSDPQGNTAVKTLAIVAGDAPPEVTIAAPLDGGTYRNGTTVLLRGSALDHRDGALTGSSLRWRIVIHHNDHIHVVASSLPGADPTFTAPITHDADSSLTITLTATDSSGLTDAETVTVRPERADLTLASSPAGAPLSYSGVDLVAPRTAPAAVGYVTSVGAASSFVSAGRIYDFARWSDGGAPVHSLTVPVGASTLTAVYVPRGAADPGPAAPVPVAPSLATPAAAAPAPAPAPPGLPGRLSAPRSTLARATRSVGGRLTGLPSNARPRVRLAVSRRWKRTDRCQWWDNRRGRFGAPTTCDAPAFFAAQVRRSGRDWAWAAKLKRPLPPGRYGVSVEARDADGRLVAERG